MDIYKGKEEDLEVLFYEDLWQKVKAGWKTKEELYQLFHLFQYNFQFLTSKEKDEVFKHIEFSRLIDNYVYEWTDEYK